MKTKIVLIFFLFTTACVHINTKHRLCNPPELVVLNHDMSQQYDFLVEDAVNWWNQQIGKKFLINAKRARIFGTSVRGFIGIMEIPESEKDIWARRHHSVVDCNRCLFGTTIWIRDNGYYHRDTLYYILLHELGHAIGLRHSRMKNTVMYKTKTNDSKIILGLDTKEDLKVLYDYKN